MSENGPHLKVFRQDEVIIVELVDRKILDEPTVSQVSHELFALAAEAEKPRIVLDFANVSHMSSSVLGILITLHKRVREKGGQLRLCNIRQSIYEVFVITRLNTVFGICDSRDDAAREAASA